MYTFVVVLAIQHHGTSKLTFIVVCDRNSIVDGLLNNYSFLHHVVHIRRCCDARHCRRIVVVVVVEMNIIKVALSHFCCRTTVQSNSVSVARQVTVRRW